MTPREWATQRAPFPRELESLVKALRYRDGWTFRLTHDAFNRGQDSAGLTLRITVSTNNSYPPHEPIVVDHYMIVPPASYNLRSWQRWLFEQVLLVERHEAMEHFTLRYHEGFDTCTNAKCAGWSETKPYAPLHGPGNDPYLVVEYATDAERRTSFTGEVSGE